MRVQCMQRRRVSKWDSSAPVFMQDKENKMERIRKKIWILGTQGKDKEESKVIERIHKSWTYVKTSTYTYHTTNRAHKDTNFLPIWKTLKGSVRDEYLNSLKCTLRPLIELKLIYRRNTRLGHAL